MPYPPDDDFFTYSAQEEAPKPTPPSHPAEERYLYGKDTGVCYLCGRHVEKVGYRVRANAHADILIHPECYIPWKPF